MRISAPWSAAAYLTFIGLTSAALAANDPFLRPRDYDNREYYALHLAPGANPERMAGHVGLQYEGPLGQLDGHYLFSGPKGDLDVVTDYRRKRRRRSGDYDAAEAILFSEKQKLKTLHKRMPPPPIGMPRTGKAKPAPQRIEIAGGEIGLKELQEALSIKDPIFNEQWHLFNTQDREHDLNVTGVWLNGITGFNSTVAIVDDGLDMYSEDLKDNYFAAGSYDFNDHKPEPKPVLLDDRHGTRCAGEIAAVKNNVCGIGVAYDAKVAGIRILSKQISDADEAVALNYAFQENQIYSCSWGPPDDGQAMEAPGLLIKKAMVKGVQDGRQGLGSVFVFASGNGAANDDNCNFDGYTNSIYSITVGAIDKKGHHPYYSELCSAQMVVTYSSGAGDSIHTTDVGVNECYGNHGGTSAAAPLAAGVFALALSVRPDLSWRDLQYLTMLTAVPFNENDEDWEETAMGKKFNHKYGYGKLDAYALVEAAKDFVPVKPQGWYHSPKVVVNHPIPEGNTGLKTELIITKEQLDKANFEKIEHVTVTMNAKHSRRGDMSVDLISPKGIVSHIATVRNQDQSTDGYKDWEFMTVKHWGEDGVGTWTIVIKDTNKNGFNGTLLDWSINLWGLAADAEKAVLHPLPGEEQSHPLHVHPQPTKAPDHITTTSVSSPTNTGPPPGNPDDHQERPTKKPEGQDDAEPAPTESGQPIPIVESSPQTDHGGVDPIAESEQDTEPGPATGFLPSFLPTFGVSATTQIWIYGSFVVIAGFVGAVAFYLIRQRRIENARKDGMNYEFEALNNEEVDDGATAPALGGRRKARDLYDAFGASDDEELFSDDESVHEKGYYDEDGPSSGEGSHAGSR